MKKFFKRFIVGTGIGVLFFSFGLSRDLAEGYNTDFWLCVIVFASISMGLFCAIFCGEEAGIE